jgi:hypothetical protein
MNNKPGTPTAKRGEIIFLNGITPVVVRATPRKAGIAAIIKLIPGKDVTVTADASWVDGKWTLVPDSEGRRADLDSRLAPYSKKLRRVFGDTFRKGPHHRK